MALFWSLLTCILIFLSNAAGRHASAMGLLSRGIIARCMEGVSRFRQTLISYSLELATRVFVLVYK